MMYVMLVNIVTYVLYIFDKLIKMMYVMLVNSKTVTWLSRGSHHEFEVSITTHSPGAALSSVFNMRRFLTTK